jgi:hypothetical protein
VLKSLNRYVTASFSKKNFILLGYLFMFLCRNICRQLHPENLRRLTANKAEYKTLLSREHNSVVGHSRFRISSGIAALLTGGIVGIFVRLSS